MLSGKCSQGKMQFQAWLQSFIEKCKIEGLIFPPGLGRALAGWEGGMGGLHSPMD